MTGTLTEPRTAPATDAPSAPGAWRSVALIAGREMAVQFRRKELWGSLVLTVVVLLGVMGLQQVFSGAEKSWSVGVVGERPAVDAALAADGDTVTVVTLPAGADPATELQNTDLDAVWTADETLLFADSPASDLVEPLQQAHVSASLVDNLRAAGLDQAGIERSLTVTPLTVTSIDPDAAAAQQRTITAVFGVLILFFLMFMFGQSIAQGVLEEKSSRIVEVLLAKVRAWQLLTGKVLGVGAVVLTQMIAILAAGVAGALLFGVVDSPADLARIGALVVVWFIPGYILFATLWAVAGALVSRPEDLNHAAGPVSLLQTIGLFGALVPFVGLSESVTRVLSLVPGTSWAVMPVRMAAGAVPAWEIAVSMLLMVLAIGALLRLGGRIYLGGVLEHGGMVRTRAAIRNARERGLS